MSIAAVPLHPFYLRSQNALGCIYLHVSEHRISEICLFPDKASFEVYPLDVQKLVNKGVTFQLSEITMAVFEDAINQFFERFASTKGGSNPSARVLPLLFTTSSQAEQVNTTAQAINESALLDGLPF